MARGIALIGTWGQSRLIKSSSCTNLSYVLGLLTCGLASAASLLLSVHSNWQKFEMKQICTSTTVK